MTPSIRLRFLLRLTLGAATGLVSTLNAADWYLQANSGLSQHWHTPAAWWSQPSGGGTNPSSISNADTFHTNGYVLRTPETSVASPFTGGVLIIDGGSVLIKQNGTSTNPVTIPALLTKGGSARGLSNGSGGTQILNVTDFLTTRSEVTSFNTGGATRGLNLTFGNLRGDGDLQLLGGGIHQLAVTTGTGFYGTLYLTGSSTLSTTSAANLKGSLVIEAGSKVNLNHNLTVTSLVVGGTTNATDGLAGLKRNGTTLAANTTYTFAQLQTAFPAIFLSGSGSITVTQPALAVNAANVIDNVGIGQLGVNLSAGKFWMSTTPNYRADLERLKVGMIRTGVYPSKDYTLNDMDIRVAQIINAGGVPLFVGPITKPNPPFNTEQQHLHDNFLDLNGNIGSGTIATNIAFLVQRYKAPPFNLTTQYWEVGNEPDISVDYQVASPQEYIDAFQSVHNQLIASGVRQNVKLCGPVVAAEYGFAMNANRADNILNAFFAQCAAPLNGYQQVDVVTRHLYAEIYDWETNAPDPVENAYNILNHPTEQVSFTQARIAQWPYRGEGAIQGKLREYGFPENVGTGITEFNIPLEMRHTITQGLWFLTYDHFSLYNPRNILSSGFAFDIKTNPAMHYYQNNLPNHAWWATYVHNRLTGDEILEQHSSDTHLLVTGTQDERYVYVQVLNRNDGAITASLAITNAPVSGSTNPEMFVMSATELPDVAVPTSLGTSFSYTFPAMTTRVFRYLRSDAPAIVAPPGPPTSNVVLDTTFTTAPDGMLTYHTGSFQPAVITGDLKLTHNSANLTTAVVFAGQPLAASQKRMQARFGYRINSGHAGSGFVFGAYSANPAQHGAGLAGLGFYQQPNVLFGVKVQAKGTEPDLIAITPAPVTPNVDGFASQPLPLYPWGYAEDMFVVIDYDGDAGTVRTRLYKGANDSTAPVADLINRLGNPASLPAGTVFGFTSSTASFSQINLIQNLKITTDNGAALTAGTPFTLQSWTAAPWSATAGATSFSAGFSPDGIPVTLTFGSPKTGVNVTVPATPNFTGAVNSAFGFESSGFGVGTPTNVGRFERGESFTLQTNHAFALQQISWYEWTGDEQVHVQWTQGGVVQQQVFTINAALFNFTSVQADANTPVVFTNVSPTSANLSGRLRVKHVVTALLN
ncbi:hypothetical protein [Rariglobus hedericola]|uniref:Asl1-like glycosyl hydrolase catalytic domain-containing protein n=3 Tax=Rariglobus hedericola TaxID=2597822 RepID=A0A556QNE6_9BACT|nr:hypothetical protein [Rariglobus hedericola]TSJ78149.1 hypothetical protein FPL22_02235 [Rariglobus hedericola]